MFPTEEKPSGKNDGNLNMFSVAKKEWSHYTHITGAEPPHNYTETTLDYKPTSTAISLALLVPWAASFCGHALKKGWTKNIALHQGTKVRKLQYKRMRRKRKVAGSHHRGKQPSYSRLLQHAAESMSAPESVVVRVENGMVGERGHARSHCLFIVVVRHVVNHLQGRVGGRSM